MNNLKANMYKFMKTKGYLMHLLVPIIGVLAFALYFHISPMSEAKKVCLYLEIIGIMMPSMVSIVIAKQCEEERKAGGFQNILSCPSHRVKGHFDQLFVLLIWGFLAVFIAVMGMGIVMHLDGKTSFSLLWYLKMSGFLYASNLCWYALVYIICYSFGSGISLGVGIIGTILAALMRVGLNLGDQIWQFIPSCYSTRIMMSEVNLKAAEFADDVAYVKKTLENGIGYNWV